MPTFSILTNTCASSRNNKTLRRYELVMGQMFGTSERLGTTGFLVSRPLLNSSQAVEIPREKENNQSGEEPSRSFANTQTAGDSKTLAGEKKDLSLLPPDLISKAHRRFWDPITRVLVPPKRYRDQTLHSVCY